MSKFKMLSKRLLLHRSIPVWLPLTVLLLCLCMSAGAAFAGDGPGGVSALQGTAAPETLSTLEGGPIFASGDTDVAQTFTSSDSMTWYVRGIQGKPKEVTAYAGTDPVPVESFGNLLEGDGPAPKTLILVDNSWSIGGQKEYVEKIKAILTRLIWNHQPMERFAIKTFSDHAETIVDYTDNYDSLRLAVEGLAFKDQDTYLRNVLYGEIVGLTGDGEDDYSRIIVISDGTEDSRMGVTYEELIALLADENHRLPIYTIGFKYNPAVGELDKLFSLSRKTNTPYFWVEDYEDVALIADGITADANNVNYFKFSFPPHLRTGDVRGISLGVKTDSSRYEIVHVMALSTASLGELEAMQAEKEELQEYRNRQDEQLGELASEVAAMQLEREELQEYRNSQNEQISELASELAAEPWLTDYPSTYPDDAYTEPETEPETLTNEPGTAGGTQENGEDTPEAVEETQEYTEEVPDDTKKEDYQNVNTLLTVFRNDLIERNLRSGIFIAVGVLLLALIGLIIYGDRTRRNRKDFQKLQPAVKEENDEPAPEPDAALTKRIIFMDMAQPDMQYTIDLGKSMILGRSRARCDISFPEDRSMASRQARVYFEFGRAFLENLDTVGSTVLNGEVVNGSKELISGSVLQLGDTRLRIKYE